MTIDDNLLTHLEKLSKLTIAPEKRGEMERHLTNILSFVDKLNELDTSRIDGAEAFSNTSARLREDLPSEDSGVFDDLIRHAPERGEREFLVPRVV